MERNSSGLSRRREIDAVRAEARRFITPAEREELQAAPETIAARGLAAVEQAQRQLRAEHAVVSQYGGEAAESPDGDGGGQRGRATRPPHLMIRQGEISFH